MRTRVWILTLLGAAVLAIPALFAPPAHAAGDEWSITRYEVDAQFDADGVAQVQVDLEFDFGAEEAHGPYLTFVDRQPIDDDPDHYRVLEYSGFEAISPSGAPADVRVEDAENAVAVYIGDEDVEITGLQRYTLTYRVDGIAVSGVGDQGQDEIYWQVIGQDFEVPLAQIRITVSATEAPEEAACWAGDPGSDIECSATVVGAEGAELHQGLLHPGQPMSVAVQFPAGTFGGAQPILTTRHTFANTIGLTRATGLGAAGATLFGVGLVVLVARGRGRDEQYMGVTPGLTPARTSGTARLGGDGGDGGTRDDGAGHHGAAGAGATAPGATATEPDDEAVGPRRGGPIAVQFQPPAGVRPGEMGTLADEVADPHDVTATIVDLAVRGYFRIEEYAGDDEAQQWRLTRPERAPELNHPDLLAYERDVLTTLFPGQERTVELREIAGEFSAMRSQLQQDLYAEVTERGWFRTSPAQVRMRWWLAAIGLFVVGIGLGLVLAFTLGLGVLGLPVIATAVAVAVAASYAPARTASGTAVLVQSLGFKKYLETAEANQLRFEEDEDIFSRYLPFAIAFEVTDRWAKVFEDIARSGGPVPEPDWYSGPALGSASWAGALGASMASFSSAADAAVVSAGTGGSAISGGGFAGGGAGGGGGGGW
ncbi:DUF2207 domain-containing protein [Pseudactinotalea sp. Z1748]